MSPLAVFLLVCFGTVGVIVVVTAVVLFAPPADVQMQATGNDTYRVRTPLGRAWVRGTFHDERGHVYEITTRFRGEGQRVYYVGPSLVLVKNRLDDLVTAGVAELLER